MKKLLLCALIITSLPLIASEKCKIQGHASIFLENGSIYRNIKIPNQRFITRTNSWEDCYAFALKKAKSFRSTIVLNVSGWRVLGESADTLAYISYDWTFNDGYVFDTSGKITKYTDKFESSPIDGDLRYFSDGTIFE